MAIITEEKEEEKLIKQSQPNKDKPTSPNPTPNPFTFWFYFTLVVSIVTFLFASLSSSQDPKAWFLSLPNHLRQHYSKGRTVKVQTSPNHTPIEVFIRETGPILAEHVLIVHGLGLSSYDFGKVSDFLGSKGVHVVALDLPGSGFSENFKVEVDESENGLFGRLRFVYSVIKEKGLFWAFDRMVETGEIPYEEIENWVSNRKSYRVLELGDQEVSGVLSQVIDSMKMSPVHLVLHDSALGMCANWALENSGSIRSLTLLDTESRLVPALPYWTLELPVIKELVLGYSSVYAKILNSCCSKSIDSLALESYRVFLKHKDGTNAVVGMAKKLNHSFDLAEWGGSDELKNVPMQVVWSSGWSEEWSNEGNKVVNALPCAKFVPHSGGRWPQDNAADEVAGHIVQFVLSLPKSVGQAKEEPRPEHIKQMFDEAQGGDHGHDHESHHGHAHIHEGDFMDSYGLGQGWGS